MVVAPFSAVVEVTRPSASITVARVREAVWASSAGSVMTTLVAETPGIAVGVRLYATSVTGPVVPAGASPARRTTRPSGSALSWPASASVSPVTRG